MVRYSKDHICPSNYPSGDGAQGTDLACLVRRLKVRLRTPQHFLCCVGTSATLGNDNDHSTLCDYAAKVFGEPFDEDAVLTEARLSAGEFLEDSLIARVEVVPAANAQALNPEIYDPESTGKSRRGNSRRIEKCLQSWQN
jgi:DEAD/DEAH box helicase domain-containing protein